MAPLLAVPLPAIAPGWVRNLPRPGNPELPRVSVLVSTANAVLQALDGTCSLMWVGGGCGSVHGCVLCVPVRPRGLARCEALHFLSCCTSDCAACTSLCLGCSEKRLPRFSIDSFPSFSVLLACGSCTRNSSPCAMAVARLIAAARGAAQEQAKLGHAAASAAAQGARRPAWTTDVLEALEAVSLDDGACFVKRRQNAGKTQAPEYRRPPQ